MQPLRFLVVSIIGVSVDIGLAWALVTAFGLRLWIAGFLGFAVAAVLNYLLHEAWTFRDDRFRGSVLRFGRNLIATAVTLSVRMAAILALQNTWIADKGPLAVLLPSVALSFCAGFLAAKFWVFRKPKRQERHFHDGV